ncbi:MAG: CinA family protein [Eubacterium sp.]|jgi:PncC family amidohydrolase|nr:CinA family protein [Eubacterium sp.]
MSRQERLVEILIEKGFTISFAESCTGGKMAAAVVDVADASKVLNASFVTYSNEAKMKYLNVQSDTLENFGAVSEQTAKEMAEGIAKANNADIGVGITGIAGPGGGTDEKPVGTVCFGYCIQGRTLTETVHFGDLGRNIVRDRSVGHVLDTLINKLN